MAARFPHHRGSSHGFDPDDDDEAPFDLDPVADLRPLEDPTWRERLDDLTEHLRRSPLRIVGTVLAIAVFAAAGWWLLRPPDVPPIEAALPFTTGDEDATASGTVNDPSTDGTDAAGGSASADGPRADTENPIAGTEDGTGAGEAGPAEIVIAVAGAVNDPGVHRLPDDARVHDALRAAGGTTPDADDDRLNLAAPLADGERIWVPRIGDDDPPPIVHGDRPTGGGGSGDGTGAGGDGEAGVVDLNRATAAELEALPGVGPATAAAIVEHRESHGFFASVDELLDVSGIGEAKLEQIRPRATV